MIQDFGGTSSSVAFGSEAELDAQLNRFQRLL